MKYEKGMRVRRKAADTGSGPPVGAVGEVQFLKPLFARVLFDDAFTGGYGKTGREWELYFDDLELAAADAPAVGAPACEPLSAEVSSKIMAELEQRNETIRQQNKQIGELEAALKEATGSKLRVGDLHGTAAALRSRVDELEGTEAWLRREVVRLGGKARMR